MVARKRQPLKAAANDASMPAAPAQPKSMAIRRKAPTNTAVEPIKKSIAIKRKAAEPPKPMPKKNFVAAPPKDNDDSDLEIYAKVAKPEPIAGELMLNICTAPSSKMAPKKKLNQQERLQQKRLQRQGDGPLQRRTLTSKELSQGIRKFSQNPNQRPRASDLFEQKEREERQKTKNPDDKVEEEEEHELGHVDPTARKANAFRVRRPGDSSVRKIGLFKDQPEKIEMGQRLVKPITEKVFDGTKVESLELHPHTVKNLADVLSITQLTTVQQKTVPKAMEGKWTRFRY